MRRTGIILILILMTAFWSCTKDKPDPVPPVSCDYCGCSTPDFSNTTPADLEIPGFIPAMPVPTDNPITEEGVELGRFLFWDKQLSLDGTISCGDCHMPEFGFSDPAQFSSGVNGALGVRQSMSLVNLAWADFYFWDGRAATLEELVFHPIIDPIEMSETVGGVLEKIESDSQYPPMFEQAFGSSCVDSVRIAKAVAQFLRTMVSFNSDLDNVLYGPGNWTAEQFNGFELFQLEGGDPADGQGGQWGADCFHCHGGSFNFFTDHQLHNNGLDSVFTDQGAYAVTGNMLDMGRFKTPSLRNIEVTAPYMHDGRFSTLEEVIGHYNTGGVPSATIDPFMKYTQGGLQLSPQDQSDIIEFLKMLTDEEFLNNPAFTNPH